MNRLYYLLTALRLRLAARRALAAKDRLTSAIHSTREGAKKLDGSYARFLRLSERQERIAVRLRKLYSESSGRPILNRRIQAGEPILSKEAEQALTVFDIRLALVRHRHCDWGELPPTDWWANNEAVKDGSGIVRSRYLYHGDGCFLVKTDLTKRATHIRMEETP